MPTLLLRFIITCGNFRNNNEYYFFFTGEAESGLERLHQCAEKDLQAFLPSLKPDSNETMTSSVADFGDFRVKLAGLTR